MHQKSIAKAMKQVIISTSALNSYGTRVLTSGMDIEQYKRNPVLLWMHRRYDREDIPIGRIDDIHIDGDKIIGTPVFDMSDEFAAKIARKWEEGFLRMSSAGLTVIELSDAPEHLLPGQTRMTISKSKLDEVSIVDIGANDEALAIELYNTSGERITLASGSECPDLPLLPLSNPKVSPQNTDNMNEKIALALGLSQQASEAELIGTIEQLKLRAKQAEEMSQALVRGLVDEAVRLGKLTEAQRAHYTQIGLTMGAETLRITLSDLSTARRPSELIHPSPMGGSAMPQQYAKLSDVPVGELDTLKRESPQEYARLYKAEFGIDLPK